MSSGTGPLTTTVVTEDTHFSALAQEWDRLLDHCSSATPFQAHAWLDAWWRAYGTPGTLRVVLVREGVELVAAAALYAGRGLSRRTLLPVGQGQSDYCDILVHDAATDRAELLSALSSAILALPAWDALDLPEVRRGAAAFDLVQQWTGPWSSTTASQCLELPVEDITDLIARLPRSTAKHLRRKLRNLDQVGVATEVVPNDDVPGAVADFHRLHADQWEGRGVNPEHVRPRFQNFLADAMPLMVARRQALVCQYRLAGETVGVRINVVGPSLMGAYLSGTSPALRGHLDVATLLLRHNLELAQEWQTPVLSLLRGREDYKQRWRPTAASNTRLVLGRSGNVLARARLMAAEVRARVLPWVKQRAPWIKDARALLVHRRRRRTH